MTNFIVFKIMFFSTISFLFAWICAPFLSKFLHRFKFNKSNRDEKVAPIYSRLHKGKEGTPTMGGILIWGTTLVIALFFYALSIFIPHSLFDQLHFLTRSQVLLPLGALVLAAIVGLFDDLLNIKKIGPIGGGLRMRHRVILYTLIASVCAWWFYFKLDWDILHIPFIGDFNIGIWYIPFFIFVIVSTAFSVNEIDGLDGLAGGTLLASFAAFGAIAAMQGKVDLAAFCAAIIGSLLAFLWLNIYPAKFFMGDTGAMSLGVTLGVVAMLTNSALLLPIICLPLIIESFSVIIQVTSKKLLKRKIFLSAPIHHHLEAIGWSEPTIVMRFWVIAFVMAIVGLIIALMERGLY